MSGFRAFTVDSRKRLVRCHCDFGGVKNAELHKHYRVQLGDNALERRADKAGHIAMLEAMKVARVYGARPEIYRRLSWNALFELSSPKMAQSVRKALEAKIIAGESVTAPQIRKARGRLKGGCLKRKPDHRRFA
jgi:hypothetical protein